MFGLDVLESLVQEIRSATTAGYATGGHPPVVLGCAMVLNDEALMTTLEDAGNACIVITKQEARRREKPPWARLTEFAASHELIARAYPELEDLAPRDEHGQPRVVGPFEPMWTNRMRIGAVREVGFRKMPKGPFVPIVHAKLALLGHYDRADHPAGGQQELFVPDRLWISSANFTDSSRRSLEFGLWTSEPELLQASRRFLVGLIATSEPLGKGPDLPDPELVPVEFDDEEFARWAAEDEHHDH